MVGARIAHRCTRAVVASRRKGAVLTSRLCSVGLSVAGVPPVKILPFLLVFAVLFAGCAAGPEAAGPRPVGFDDEPIDGETLDGEPGNESIPPAAEDRGPAVRQYTGTMRLTVTQVLAGTSRINTEPNCMKFGKGTVWLVFNGTAEAVWSPVSQFAERLEVEIWDGGGQGRLATNDGSTSPSVLDYGQFRITQASTLGLAFVVQPSDNGAVVQQSVELTVSFNYVGRPDLSPQPVPCVYAEPTGLDEVET
jgi:hypothetical protein